MRFRIVLIGFLVIALALTACKRGDTGTADSGESESQQIQIYLVALEGTEAEGKSIGCGDTLVSVERMIETTDGTLPESIKGALTELFDVTGRDLSTLGLYSALNGQDVQVDSVRIENKRAIVNIIGQPALGGVCDAPRFYEQIEATVAQFAPLEGYTILLNGTEAGYKEIGDMKGSES